MSNSKNTQFLLEKFFLMCYYTNMRSLNLTLPKDWVEIPKSLYQTYGITDLEELPVISAFKMGITSKRICMVQDYGTNVNDIIDELLDTNINMDKKNINKEISQIINADVNIKNICIENYRIGGIIPSFINVIKNSVNPQYYIVQIFLKDQGHIICFSFIETKMDENNPVQFILKDNTYNTLINKVIPSIKK